MAEPTTDFPSLNPDDPTVDAWRVPKEDLQGDRPPGLIDLHRYPMGLSSHGIATFLQRPVALTPADLQAADVDVAIVGAGLDLSIGMRGTGHGPRALRSHDMYLPTVEAGLPHQHTRVDALSELVIADYGDAGVDPDSAHRSIEPVRHIVREIAEAGSKPFIIGGDHSLMYPDVAALADVYGKGKIGVVHFDAHYDAGSVYFGHTASHGVPVRRLVEQGHVEGKNFIQVGLRGYAPGDDDLAWMKDHGFRYHFMAEVEKFGWEHVMERALEEAADGTDYLFVSLDIDVLDPAFAPGTGTPEPGGLTPRELFPLLRRLGAENNLVGMELVELNPLVDPTYVTPLVANRCLREVLTGVAMRKKGITEKNYLHPDAIDHGQG
ncbi:MAG: agmatinase family protein [Acidimicrobiia bacterium]